MTNWDHKRIDVFTPRREEGDPPPILGIIVCIGILLMLVASCN